MVDNDIAGKIGLIKHYSQNNNPKYDALLSIPVSDRLPELSKKVGVSEIGKIIMAEITKFQNCYNVIRPMNADQIAQCAFSILQSSEEDFLSLQDIIIFFEGAKQGKYGKVYDRLDQQVIFDMLEIYRESRHQSLINMKEEQHSQYKTVPINDRISNNTERQEMRSALNDYLKSMPKPNE